MDGHQVPGRHLDTPKTCILDLVGLEFFLVHMGSTVCFFGGTSLAFAHDLHDFSTKKMNVGAQTHQVRRRVKAERR